MRNLLVVVDMQNDFIDGSLGTKEAVAIVDNVIAEIAKYDTKDIFATRDTHPENYLETQEGKNLPVVHCVKGTDGWQINEKVKTALKDAVVIDKPTFGSKILAEEITKIVANHSQVGWTNNKTIHDRISQDIDDLFYDYEKERGLKLSFDTIDKIIENVKTVALRRF